ncbi:hypothetical protein [Rhodococcus rhodochrous]|uniref:hypothetical protein n=1 Tax=Rhodococcus rhodochrous TaxID=1829 RepID=UPI0023F61A66
MTENAVFTAIPAGRIPETGALKVTVFVTPKLDIGGLGNPGDLVELAAFEAFSNWPRTIVDAVWMFDVYGRGQIEGQPLESPIVPDPGLWDTLFGRTRVGDGGFQHFEKAVVHSYPVNEVLSAVTELYRTIAVTSPHGFPPITGQHLGEAIEKLGLPSGWDRGREGGRRAGTRAGLEQLRKGCDERARYVDFDKVSDSEIAKVALAAAVSFYDRGTDDPSSEAAASTPAPEPIPPEFHSFVARCADFPELLRHLGLAIDLQIPDDPSIDETTTIQIVDVEQQHPLSNLLVPSAARPFTAVHYTDQTWTPAAWEGEPDIIDGSLAIDDTQRFTVDQFDPDGSVLKLTTFLADLARRRTELLASKEGNNNARSMTPDASSLPALKSAGLLISRHNRAAQLVRHFDHAAKHEHQRNNGDPATLWAPDVTRGWRVEVSDTRSATEEWLSLHRRIGRYELVAKGEIPQLLQVQPKPDEGYLKAVSTSSNEPSPQADQYLHETLAGWDGWSLAVKRPGRPQNETDTVAGDAEPDVADTEFPLAVRFRVAPGSLPRLRFGRQYRLRVRAVDLSGRSIPTDQLDDTHVRELTHTYQRWEPVPSPTVVPLTEFTEGESLMRMVIRSTLDVSVDDYTTLDRIRNLTGHRPSGDIGIVYRPENERHLAAPITGVQFAETHGVSDTAFTGNLEAVAAQFEVAKRESGSYLKLPGGRIVNHLDQDNPMSLDDETDRVLGEGEYVVHPTHDLPLPYLPDPLSRGVSFTTLPGHRDTRNLPWPGDPDIWYDRQPILLRIVEGSGPSDFNYATRTLTVSLPKATLTTVRLSSFLGHGDVELMRVWHLIIEQEPPTHTQFENVRSGQHWMVTPFSELTLVHAVEKPLEPPTIVLGTDPVRYAHETYSRLPGTVNNHAASTGRIDIDAVWDDPVDDVMADGPAIERKSAHVGDFQLEPSETQAQLWPSRLRHEFGDTRHRYVHYTPTATTRFREYFPATIANNPDLVTAIGPALTVDVPSSARPAQPDVRYIVPTWEWHEQPLDVPRSAFAVRRVRTGGGLRVYLERGWNSSGPDELLGVVLPIQPWISWIPDLHSGVLGQIEGTALTDAWAQRVFDHLDVPVRAGTPVTEQLSQHLLDSSLRTEPQTSFPETRTDEERFLVATRRAITAARRDDDVMIKAVTSAAKAAQLVGFTPLFTQTGPEARRFTSIWGADPVFEGDAVPDGPYIHQFGLRNAVGHAIKLAEVPGETVTVVGHRAVYDPDRKLWYSDIQLDAGSAYTPFVKLALARYQPHSVAGEEMSKVVIADFAQLLPIREATYVLNPDGSALTVTLSGAVGIPHHAQSLPDFASRIRASRHVETWIERLPAESTSDLDWERVDQPVTLTVRLGSADLVTDQYGNVEWAGAVRVPDRAKDDRLRVRIVEYEVHRADSLTPRITPAKRLVYSDGVDLL